VASETIAVEHAEHGEEHGHSLLHHHFDDLDQQRECNSLGMWSFLATEVMMFGGLFFAYTLYRHLYPGGFHVGSHHLNITLGTINTFVLLFSSLTMALGVHAASESNSRALVTWLVITWLFGASFLGIKYVEWTTDYKEGLVPGLNFSYYQEPGEAETRQQELVHQNTTEHAVMMYFVIYFCMTGLHALHMVVGLVLVGTFIVMGSRRRFENGNDQPVEIMGLYWHLVDIVWIFLFPLLYLIAGFRPL
jgi:cytochrome c oxidase subunit 3